MRNFSKNAKNMAISTKERNDDMLLIASRNGEIGMDAAWEVLAQGGSALDAVEVVARLVEDNPEEHTVGYGGYPNLLGEVELDASLMDGTRLRAGAVGALRGYRHPISIARRVLEELPHIMLVGEGAALFAERAGFVREETLSNAAAAAWREGIEQKVPDVFADEQHMHERLLNHTKDLITDPEHVMSTGTVTVIAQDSAGQIASAASTSGGAWKYPGRVGDSPIIGAGQYADNRYGAAACTGWGELAMRTCTAHSVVLYLKQGYTLQAACQEALHDVLALHPDPERMFLSIIAIDHAGNHCAMTTAPKSNYVIRMDGMESYEKRPRQRSG